MALLKGDYYDIRKLLELGCEWNLVLGERSSGKTYSSLKVLLEDAWKGKNFAYVRRYDEDFKSRRGSAIFQSLEQNNEITKITHGKWTGIRYYSKRFYWCKYDKDGKCVYDESPIGWAFSLASGEHDKSSSYNTVYNILMDEMVASGGAYLNNKFVLLCNTISTIARDRMCRIILLGNTVSKVCPYFSELKIDINKLKQGSINVIEYDKGLRLAVEMTDSTEREKESDRLFSFGNAKLNMIKGAEGNNGDNSIWQFDLYPHLFIEYEREDILFTYFIEYTALNKLYQCEMIQTKENEQFTFIHEKTTPLKNKDQDLIFSDKLTSKPNYRYGMLNPKTLVEKKINEHFKSNNVYYSNNEVGDAIKSFRLLVRV